MESFLEYLKKNNPVILEYRHKDAFGNIKTSLVNPNNKKGGSDIVRVVNRKNISTKGPYQKIRHHNQILIGDELLKELASMGSIEFEDGKQIKRKNSNQILKMFINLHGQQCGKIIDINK